MIYGHGLHIEATVKQSNSSAVPCTVTSISDTIIKFDCVSQFNPEEAVSLKVQGLNIITARLLWKKGDEYGCRIDYVFHPAVINAVVDQSRADEVIDQPYARLIKTTASQRCSW